jgi:hypothetical protein
MTSSFPTGLRKRYLFGSSTTSPQRLVALRPRLATGLPFIAALPEDAPDMFFNIDMRVKLAHHPKVTFSLYKKSYLGYPYCG